MSDNWDITMYMDWFRTIEPSEWFELSSQTKLEGKLKGFDRSFLYQMGTLAGHRQCPSQKQVIKAKKLYDEIEHMAEEEIKVKEMVKKKPSQICVNKGIRHMTVRVAWHDSKWNGCICSDPENNNYCVGEFSLLSRRLRENRDLTIETLIKGKDASLLKPPAYMPPCFWSINAFGENRIQISHENPAVHPHHVDPIPEELPPHSIFTWPFKLSFVREREQVDHYGDYFPESMLESRIDTFRSHFKPGESIAFLYANYDNPVSGEEQKYLVVGCAVIKDHGEKQYFDFKPGVLEKIQTTRRGAKNFPKINWAMRYTLDYPNNAIVLPYHEYLEYCNNNDDPDLNLMENIKVTVDEPELVSGFKYVAMDIDEDQTIYLLFKIRKSLINIQDHKNNYIDAAPDFDAQAAVNKIDELITKTWQRRGLLPGFSKLVRAFLKIKDVDEPKIDQIIPKCIETFGPQYISQLAEMIENPDDLDQMFEEYDDIFGDLSEVLDDKGIQVKEFITVASLNLTRLQFDRILNFKEKTPKFQFIARNPYILYEEYEPGEELEYELTGEKLDDVIDLQKIDIAMFPKRKYIKPDKYLHTMKQGDPKRVRALVLHELDKLENWGHCFEEAGKVQKQISEYPLFYRDEDYELNINFSHLNEEFREHFEEKLVIKEDVDKQHCYFYLNDVYFAEESIKEKLITLLEKDDLNVSYQFDNTLIDKSIQNLEKDGKLDENDKSIFRQDREHLFDRILKKRLYILSGSPGSGKSYELLRFIETINNNGEDYLLLAPTGKATLRLNNNSDGFNNIKAETIDRYITRNTDVKSGTIQSENIIVDEMSMVDLFKFYKLLQKFDFESPNFKRLILVGDPHQLPPIGYGKVFQDAIDYITTNVNYKDHYTYLSVNCRASMDEDYLSFIRVFTGENKNYEPIFYNLHDKQKIGNNCNIHFWKEKEQLQEKIVNQFKSCYAAEFSKNNNGNILDDILGLRFDGTKDEKMQNFIDSQNLERFQIISPYRTAFSGAIGLNQFFQKEFRSINDAFYFKEHLFRIGDKIIRTENFYQFNDRFKRKNLILSNGSIGAVGTDKRLYFPESDNPFSKYDFRDDQFALAYAITVHKAQGSGFDDVFIVIPPRMGLLSRELLYTALTRTKEHVELFIYGDPEYNEENLFDRIRKFSAKDKRRTSLFLEPHYGYSYIPEEGTYVRSRVEYIIFKKLQEAKENHVIDDFAYEAFYELKNHPFDFHPDFTIILHSGREIIWEHLGMITDYTYRTNWKLRYDIYKEQNEQKNIITTDECMGINDKKVEAIIQDIANEDMKSDNNSVKYSLHHYSLN